MVQVCGLKWSPNGRQLASGGNDNMLCVWDETVSQARLLLECVQRAVPCDGVLRARVLFAACCAPRAQVPCRSCQGARMVPVPAEHARKWRRHGRPPDCDMEYGFGRVLAGEGHKLAGTRVPSLACTARRKTWTLTLLLASAAGAAMRCVRVLS